MTGKYICFSYMYMYIQSENVNSFKATLYSCHYFLTTGLCVILTNKRFCFQVEEAEIKICEVSGEKVDNKVRLDVLKKEEQMIAEENEELLQEEEEKKRKVFRLVIYLKLQCYFNRPCYLCTCDGCSVSAVVHGSLKQLP